MSEVLWTPSPDAVAAATLTRYADWLRDRHGVDTADYAELWRWSTRDPPAFWASIVEFCEVRFDRAPDAVLEDPVMPGARWFPGAELNLAASIFAGRDPDTVAIHFASERAAPARWTWGRLAAETRRIRSGLVALGVGRGDRVAALMPNLPETVAAFLATASLGAIWSSAAPEFGARTVIDRFSQIDPVVLLVVDGYRYGGRDFDRAAVIEQITTALPRARVVRFGLLDGRGWGPDLPEASGGGGAPTGTTPETPPEPTLGDRLGPDTVPVPFDHPLWILYSSGTTGLPKAIVHSQGGILLELTKMARLHLDARPQDNVFWFTTTGWMMWNFLIGVLLSDAAIVLYDGNPGYPDLNRLWDLAAEVPITIFGTSAAYISSCLKAGIEPARGRDLSALRGLGSTGSPLSRDGFRWVYEHVGADLWLFSTSGGTDVCTAFVGGVPTLPVRVGELQARALGAAIEAWDPQGRPLVGEMGELVLTQPMPSMPVGFWGDVDGSRLREAYFSTFPGIWRHGDWIEITPEGGAIIHGRSDSTINRGGVRIGTGEIYAAVLALPAILDALVVDLPREEGETAIELFVVLAPGARLDADQAAEIRRRIREDCSPRHVPDRIRAVPEVPRTLSGKLLEVPVKRILCGADPDQVVSRGSLANPHALDTFIQLAGEPSTGSAVDGG
ncbi:MAG TPA: acetoacetate--CoA ligase [Solirubrobacteraceae bacterium]|nr:acetoacetate--CoA ligase [Solirubrobacteraceae bacterium]